MTIIRAFISNASDLDIRIGTHDCFNMGVRGLLKYIRSDHSTVKLDPIMLYKRHDETVILACDIIAVAILLVD